MKLEDEEDKEKIIVRSDGTVTYVGKDIAYQMWKFGLLEKDFYYEPFREDDGRTIWISTAAPNDAGPALRRRRAGSTTSSTPASPICRKSSSRACGPSTSRAQADKSIHFSYEMVALSPRSLQGAGTRSPAEDDGQGRSSRCPAARAWASRPTTCSTAWSDKALAEVDKRNPDLRRRRKTRIAAGHRPRRPALLHAQVRPQLPDHLRFRRRPELRGRDGALPPVHRRPAEQHLPQARGARGDDGRGRRTGWAADRPCRWPAVRGRARRRSGTSYLLASKFDEEVLHLDRIPGVLRTWPSIAFASARSCNGYYHKYPVLAEADPDLKAVRILMVALARDVLVRALDLMGIPVPERM